MIMMLPFQVSKINDIELTMTFELYFDLSWTESRFLINESSTKWGEVTSSASFSLLGIIKYSTVYYMVLNKMGRGNFHHILFNLHKKTTRQKHQEQHNKEGNKNQPQ